MAPAPGPRAARKMTRKPRGTAHLAVSTFIAGVIFESPTPGDQRRDATGNRATHAMICITIRRQRSVRDASVGVLLPEGVPQQTHRLRVDLAHPRLGYAQDVTDLGEGKTLEVVQGDDDL